MKKSVAVVFGCMALAIAVMAAVPVHTYFAKEDAEQEATAESAAQGKTAAPSASPASTDPSAALDDGQANSMSALMGKLRANPNDADTLLAIGSIFVEANDWDRAEAFFSRAVLARPADAQARFLLGAAQYQHGHMPEAAASFEEMLQIKEDADAQYNLAVIYKYHLNKKDEAEKLLKKASASASASQETRAKIQEELAKP